MSASVTGRPKKMPDADVESAMLSAGLAMVRGTGLTVSLGHLPYERIIADAGVSRSAAYRLFGSKELFFRKLVVYIAQHTNTSGLEDVQREVAAALLPQLGLLATPDGRRQLFIEACKVGAEADQRALLDDAEWRTYVALTATVTTIADDEELFAEIAGALRRQGDEYCKSMGGYYELMAHYLGIRPMQGVDFVSIARLGSAFAEGLGMNAVANPELAGQRFRGKFFSSTTETEWSLASLGITCILEGMMEPDPNWPDRELPAIEAELRELLELIANGVSDH